jgi:hypothetical protein
MRRCPESNFNGQLDLGVLKATGFPPKRKAMTFDDTSYQALLAHILDLETEKASLQILIAELVLKNQQFREALAENGIVFVPSIESAKRLLSAKCGEPT